MRPLLRGALLALLAAAGCYDFSRYDTLPDDGADAGPTVLVGSSKRQAIDDSDDAGDAEAFRFVAKQSGTVESMSVFLRIGTTATTVKIGLYADSNGRPSTLLTGGDLPAPALDAWNTVGVPSQPVTDGEAYWIALLGVDGTIKFVDGTSGQATMTSNLGLTRLPAPWPAVSLDNGSGPLSAYASGF